VLRATVQLLAAAFMAWGAWLLFAHSPAGWQALVAGAVILVAVRYERWRGRTRPAAPGSHWQATGERFEDPGSGRTVDVEYNPQTGERRYRGGDGG
jgi:hypothetical protein